jgi:hypothetical protein
MTARKANRCFMAVVISVSEERVIGPFPLLERAARTLLQIITVESRQFHQLSPKGSIKDFNIRLGRAGKWSLIDLFKTDIASVGREHTETRNAMISASVKDQSSEVRIELIPCDRNQCSGWIPFVTKRYASHVD